MPLLAAAALASCSSPEPTVIDGSSPANFAATAEQARQDLPVADRLDFDRALANVGGRRHSAMEDSLRLTTFDGMTGEQVVQDFRQRQR